MKYLPALKRGRSTGGAGIQGTGKPAARLVYQLINIGYYFEQLVNKAEFAFPTSGESTMELTGRVVIEAPREQVWRALNDPEVLQVCIPGCESLQQVSPSEMKACAQIRLGPVRARFTGRILMSEVRPDEGCVLLFEGSGGTAGFAKGSSTVVLVSEGTGTSLSYSATGTVGGKLGQVGGRMIDAAARQLADQFFGAFSLHLAPPSHSAESTARDTHEAISTGAPGASPQTIVSRPAVIDPGPTAERVRVLWFVFGAGVGSMCTAFGFWVASTLTH
ncbi:MAG: CoxG family protein [Rhizobacter sp.]